MKNVYDKSVFQRIILNRFSYFCKTDNRNKITQHIKR